MTGRLLPLHLGADSLWSRYGFSEGSPFEFEDPGQDNDDDPPHADWTLVRDTLGVEHRADLLELLVRRHLAPAIVSATGSAPEIVRIGTHHNPVRDARFDCHRRDPAPQGWEDIAVEIAPEEVLKAARDIMGNTSVLETARMLGDRTKRMDEGKTKCA